MVGGCVRDLVLGRPVSDIDLATNALPEQVEQCFPKTLAVGKSFGVIIVVTPSGGHVEVATFRSDAAYIDGRRPSGIVFATVAEDVARRDFTINALLLDPVHGIIRDDVGGLADLAARCLRVVGDQNRLREDRLRVLRACRFAAHLGLEIESQTWAGICTTEVSGLSRERIWQEVGKALAKTGRVRWWELLVTSGRWAEVLPGLPGDPLHYVAHLAQVREGDDPLLPLALLVADIPEEALLAWLSREPVPRQQVQCLRHLRLGAECLRRAPSIPARRRWLRSPESALLVQLLRCRGEVPEAMGWYAAEVAIGPLPVLLEARDLLALGYAPGPVLGQTLRAFEDVQLAGLIGERSAAMAWAAEQRAISQNPGSPPAGH